MSLASCKFHFHCWVLKLCAIWAAGGDVYLYFSFLYILWFSLFFTFTFHLTFNLDFNFTFTFNSISTLNFYFTFTFNFAFTFYFNFYLIAVIVFSVTCVFYFILVETYFLTMWREERSGALAFVSVFYILVCCILTNLFWWRHLFLLCVQFERLVETFIFGQEWQDGRWGAGVFCSLYLLCFLHLLYFCVIFCG